MELVVAIAVLALLLAVGVVLGRRLRGTSGTVGVTPPAGAPGVVGAPLTPTGTVQLAGETWSARTADDRPLERGTRVRLVAFDGLVAIVEPADGPSHPPTPTPAPPDQP